MHSSISSAAFGWIGSNSVSLYTAKLVRLPQSSVRSSINTGDPVSMEVMCAYAIKPSPSVLQMTLYALEHEKF